MTNFGKILVLFNAVLSLVFVGWAAGLYTQRIHWAPRSSEELRKKDDNESYAQYAAYLESQGVPGRLAQLHVQLEQLLVGRQAADGRYEANLKMLAELDRLRPAYLNYYQEELKLLEEGGAPILSLKEENGMLVIQRAGREPLKIVDKDAESLAAYDAKYNDLKKKLQDEQEAVRNTVQEETRLTLQLNGDPGKQRGLRYDLVQEERTLKGAQEEFALMAPMFYHIREERKLLLKRKVELEKRLRELGGDVAILGQ